MKNLVRYFIAVMVILSTHTVFAGNSTVIVPSQQGGFKFGIDALYLQSGNDDLTYATIITPIQQTFGLVDRQKNLFIDPNYQWGLSAQVGYLFPCTGNDITLVYTGIHPQDRNTADNPTRTPSLFPVPAAAILDGLVPELPPDFTYDETQGKANFDLNTIDIEGGQRFSSGVFDLRMFAGLRYTKLDTRLRTESIGHFNFDQDIRASFMIDDQSMSHFNGIGPRLGVDGRYGLKSCFGIDAHLGTALLIGHQDACYHLYGASRVGNIPLGSAAFEQQNQREIRVVPTIDAKFGMDYTYTVKNTCHPHVLVLEAGYQAMNYFNVVHRQPVIDINSNTIYSGVTSDVGFSGPYLGVKYCA